MSAFSLSVLFIVQATVYNRLQSIHEHYSRTLPRCVLQGVESERCASFSAALEAGKPVYTGTQATLADGKAICLQQIYFIFISERMLCLKL